MIGVGWTSKRIGVVFIGDVVPRDRASLEIEAGEAEIVFIRH